MAGIRPQSSETHRTRLTVVGDLIKFPDDVATPTADLIVRLTNQYYQAKGPTDSFAGTNTRFHIPCGT